jgi:hypothetical protein
MKITIKFGKGGGCTVKKPTNTPRPKVLPAPQVITKQI